jgi:glycosyltransferase involved in cell wall biosynthesis
MTEWLRDYHAEHWFDKSRPHSAITNGVDPAAFHPVGNRAWRRGEEPLRLVTHHWSDNWMKGFKCYQQVDEMIASGELPDVELWIIGRWPKEIRWKTARTFPPAAGAPLGDLLRQCHGYLTASLWEPGGLHFVEGAQCGLPVLYHEDGGGIVEVARPWGIGFRDDVAASIKDLQARYPELREAVLSRAPSGELMCRDYRRVVERLLVESRDRHAL